MILFSSTCDFGWEMWHTSGVIFESRPLRSDRPLRPLGSESRLTRLTRLTKLALPPAPALAKESRLETSPMHMHEYTRAWV